MADNAKNSVSHLSGRRSRLLSIRIAERLAIRLSMMSTAAAMQIKRLLRDSDKM